MSLNSQDERELLDFSDRSDFQNLNAPKKSSCLSRLFWTALVLCSLLLVAVPVMLSSIPSLKISKETTYITEPLKSDGVRVDYFSAFEQEIYPPEMKTDENGARLLVRALGAPNLLISEHVSEQDELYARQYYEKLGLDPSLQPTMKFSDPGELLKEIHDRKKEQKESPEEESEEKEEGKEEEIAEDSIFPDESEEDIEDPHRPISHPWTAEEYPELHQWLQEHEEVLDLFVEAAGKDVFCFPLVRYSEDSPLMMMVLPAAQFVRTVVRALAVRANYHIAQGNLDDAITDKIAIHRIGKFISQEKILISSLVGIAVEGIGSSLPIASDPQNLPSGEQIERLIRETENAPTRSSFVDTLKFERYTMLDMLQSMARGRMNLLDDSPSSPLPLRKSRRAVMKAFNFNLMMKKANEDFDEMIRTGKELPQKAPSLSLFKALTSKGRSMMFYEIMSRLFYPSFDAANHAQDRNLCVCNMQRIMYAMLLYHADHGTLPPAFSVDESGNPLHSWRVLLLPYLGEQERELYEQIRLDQPWDSEENRKFHEIPVAIYECPTAARENSPYEPGWTNYSVILGDSLLFNAEGKARSLSEFKSQSDEMILFLERKDKIRWMDPTGELDRSAAEKGIAGPLESEGIGSGHTGGINAADRGARVVFLSSSMNPEYFLKKVDGTPKADGTPEPAK